MCLIQRKKHGRSEKPLKGKGRTVQLLDSRIECSSGYDRYIGESHTWFQRKFVYQTGSLKSSLALPYCIWCTAVLDVTRWCGEYLGGYHVCVGEDSHSYYLGEVDINKSSEVTPLQWKVMVNRFGLSRHLGAPNFSSPFVIFCPKLLWKCVFVIIFFSNCLSQIAAFLNFCIGRYGVVYIALLLLGW